MQGYNPIKIQHHLSRLGQRHGYDVYLPESARVNEFKGTMLGDLCTNELGLQGYTDEAESIVRNFDVIWTQPDSDMLETLFKLDPAAEPTEDDTISTLFHIGDFLALLPNPAVDIYPVFPTHVVHSASDYLTQPSFSNLRQRSNGRVTPIAAEAVEAQYNSEEDHDSFRDGLGQLA